MELTESGARSRGATPFHFDDVVVDPAAHTLLRAGVPQPVEPKAFAVLLALLQQPGELIGRDDLLDRVWGHRHVTPGVLTRVIAQLRHALGDDPQQPRYIQTRHALGYSFIGQLRGEEVIPAPVGSVDAGPPVAVVPESPPMPAPEPADTAAVWGVAAPTARQHAMPWRWLVAAVLLLGALIAWAVFHRGTAPPARVAASIAVMPFTSLSSSRSDDYFAEGLAEEMRDALAGVKGLKVAASVSPAARNEAADARALGARLDVATILDASVRREGSRMRVTARLTDTISGFTLWSHTYDRELSDVFDTQSDIAGEVVHALLGVIPGKNDALAKRLAPTHDAAAFDTYLQGMQLLRHATRPEAADQAIVRFDQALQEDSGFARAQAGICRAQIWRFQARHSAEALGNAQRACSRAAQMDPTMADVNLALGDLYRAAGDPELALRHYRTSAQAPAMQVSAHVGMAKVYAEQGRHDLALEEFQQALALSPGDASVHAEIGYQHYLDGDVPQAVASYRRAVDLQPDDVDLWGTLGALYTEAGNNTEAAAALKHAIAIAPAADTLTDLGLLEYQAGNYAEAVALQRRATTLNPEDFMIWGNLGVALRADPAASAADMHKAFEEAATRVGHYLEVKPDDARAVAALGLYRVVLGDAASARVLVRRAESLQGQPGEVALLNAETLALLGDTEAARQRLARARAEGIADTLIASNFTFRRLGLLSPPGATTGKPADAKTTVPRAGAGHPNGG